MDNEAKNNGETQKVMLKKTKEGRATSYFYENIWARPARAQHTSVTTSRKVKADKKLYVDISQVAFLVSTGQDFRKDYYVPPHMDHENLWATDEPWSSIDSASDDDDVPPSSIISPVSQVHTQQTYDAPLPPRAPPLLRTPSIGQSVLLRSASSNMADANLNPDVKLKHDIQDFDSVAAPVTTKAGSVVFSNLFATDGEWNWGAKFLLAIHEPMRHALFVMHRFLDQSQRQKQQGTALEDHVLEFFSWFKTYFGEFLRTQHTVKMAVLYPLVTVKFSDKLEIIELYKEVYQFIERVQQHEVELSVSAQRERTVWLVALDAMQKDIRRLSLTLHNVLNLEERTLHPALTQTFTEKTFNSYVLPRLFRAIKSKRVVIPWIVERSEVWGGEQEKQSFQGKLPFSAKFLYRKIWRPYFMSNVAMAMKNLNEQVDPVATMETRDSVSRCSIQ